MLRNAVDPLLSPLLHFAGEKRALDQAFAVEPGVEMCSR